MDETTQKELAKYIGQEKVDKLLAEIEKLKAEYEAKQKTGK